MALGSIETSSTTITLYCTISSLGLGKNLYVPLGVIRALYNN